MIITCNECESSFNVEDSLIKESGSKVRCSKCQSIFVAYPPPIEENLELDQDEQLLGSNGDIALDDLDSTLENFFNEDSSLDTADSMKDADEELELGLGLDAESEDTQYTPAAALDTDETDLRLDELEDLLEAEGSVEDTPDDLDLKLDLGNDFNTTADIESMVDTELPELEDLSALDDESPADDGLDSLMEELNLDLEADQ